MDSEQQKLLEELETYAAKRISEEAAELVKEIEIAEAELKYGTAA